MEIRVNQTSNPKPKINPQPPKNENPQSLDQINPAPQTNNDLQRMIEEVLNKYRTSNTLQQSNLSQGEFIVKAGMKSSVIALRIENLLSYNKKVVMSGMGFAIVPLIDSILLIQKDLAKHNLRVNVSLELFEKTVNNGDRNKTISGIRVTLSI